MESCKVGSACGVRGLDEYSWREPRLSTSEPGALSDIGGIDDVCGSEPFEGLVPSDESTSFNETVGRGG